MTLEIISYHDLLDSNIIADNRIKAALFKSGIVGVEGVPNFQKTMQAYIHAVRQFSALSESTKQKYAPDRDKGDTEGYELGAEQFKDQHGNWLPDDKKASFYAFVPNDRRNKWPREVDLKTPYLELGQLIFETGKRVLNFLGLNETIGVHHDDLSGYGRMLHYQKESETIKVNPNWCGAHFDHSVFTGLAPAYYFKDGKEVEEPKESGLFIRPTNSENFIKINSSNKSILLFQVGEFGQLAAHDSICATQHLVKKAQGNIERFTFALFFNANENVVIHSKSKLSSDLRYTNNMSADGSISYRKWHEASFARYRVIPTKEEKILL